MGQVYVRASRRAKAYTRGPRMSTIARDKKIFSLMTKLDNRFVNKGMTANAARRYNRLADARGQTLQVMGNKKIKRGKWVIQSLKKNGRKYRLVSRKY